jgi:hypothetical protein
MTTVLSADLFRVRAMKIALLFLLLGALVWWSHIGRSGSAALTDQTAGPA